jgi:hypothetical protein
LPSSPLDFPSFWGSFCNIVCLVADDCVPCAVQAWHAGHPSAGGGQHLPGPAIALGPFLRLSAAPYS